MAKNATTWVKQIFKDKKGQYRPQVIKGGILRRKKTSVEKQKALAPLKAEVKRMGFFLFENQNEYLVVCGENLNLIKIR